jgi:hypothetical protein
MNTDRRNLTNSRVALLLAAGVAALAAGLGPAVVHPGPGSHLVRLADSQWGD